MKKINMEENDEVLKMVKYYHNKVKNLDNVILSIYTKRVNFLT